MTKWTNEQRRAIEHRNQNILVSAAAGSGKTAVLVERIIQLILNDKVDVDRMLIVTFTNAAAGEMKSRIHDALEEVLYRDDVDKAFISHQINILYRAKIMTLHKFCIEMVREHFYVVDIEPTFRIAKPSEIDILTIQIIDYIMEKTYESQRNSFMNLVEMYANNRSDDEIRKWIVSIYRFIQSQPNPISWLEEQMCIYHDAVALSADDFFHNQLWARELLDWCIKEIVKATDAIKTAIELCEQSQGLSSYIITLTMDLQLCEDMIVACKKGWNSAYEFASAMQFSRLKRISKDDKPFVDEDVENAVKSIRNDIVKKKFIIPVQDLLKKKSPSEHIVELSGLSEVASELNRLIVEFDIEFTKIKKQKNILDFNDLEHYAIQILQNEDIANQYKNQFQYVFMDEYQDANLVQETIINSIRRDNNLFLVGDVKQSIYRFRLADSQLFLNKYNQYALDSNEQDIRLHLTKNFRTRADILEGINHVFERLMIQDLGEISYDENARLNAGIQMPSADDTCMEFYVIDKKVEGEVLNDITDVQTEAHFVAKRIQSLLGNKIYDVKKSVWRTVEPSDIAILMRTTKNWASVFTDVLSSYGLSVSSDDSAEQRNSLEIEILLSTLKIVDNLYQDIALLTVLRSPVADFTIEQIAIIRKKYPDDNFYQSFLLYANEEDELANKINNFLEMISRWKNEERQMGLFEFIWNILNETGFYYFASAMPNGETRQANIRRFVDIAEEFENSGFTQRGLYAFLQYVEKLERAGSNMGIVHVSDNSDNSINILSIHKSKGLEFPVVILAGLGKEFNLQDARAKILMHKKYGIGLRYVDWKHRVYTDSLGQMIIKKSVIAETLAEEIRILYVAMTRAVNKLIMVGSTGKMSASLDKWQRGSNLYNLSLAKSNLDWLGMIMSGGEPAGLSLRLAFYNKQDVIEKSPKKLFDDKGDGIENNVTKEDIAERAFVSEEDFYENSPAIDDENGTCNGICSDYKINAELSDNIKKKLYWQYKYSDVQDLPFKLSVSELNRRTALDTLDDSPYGKMLELVPKPKFLDEDVSISAVDRGTMYHFFMQIIDFHADVSETGLQNQLNESIKLGIIDSRASKALDVKKISKLFQTDLGKRMVAASKLYREVPFLYKTNYKSGSVLIQGVIDCYFEQDDNIVLIDYKTDRNVKGHEIHKAQKYNRQISLYKDAIESLIKKPVVESYIFFIETAVAVKMD